MPLYPLPSSNLISYLFIRACAHVYELSLVYCVLFVCNKLNEFIIPMN